MNVKLAWTGCIIIFIITLGWSVYRDIAIEKQVTGDLRNRVVGARLQKDGMLPYFYNWRPADGMRYYDGGNFDSAKVSNITATPFFHHLLYPIADLPQRRISYIWLLLEYIIMAVLLFVGYSFAKKSAQQCAVLVTAILFFLTEAWKMHIANGQMYIIIPALCMLFYYCIYHKKNLLQALLAGTCATALVLIRPNAIIFFLPFLLLIKKMPPRFLMAFAVPVLLLTGITFASKQERAFWQDYAAQIAQQIELHQELHPLLIKNYPNPAFEDVEGWVGKQVAADYKKFPYDVHSENGNVFVIVRNLFHIKLPVWLLSAASAATMLAVFIIFIRKQQPENNYLLPHIAILGFCLYMISDLFSPIYRGQYYTVQWFFPLLVAFAGIEKKDKWLGFLLVTGLVLNILNIDFIKMEHSIGEYLLLVTLLLFAANSKTNVSL